MHISPQVCLDATTHAVLDTTTHDVESIKLTLTEIQDEAEYAEFKSLCSRIVPEENNNPILKEMQFDQFYSFLCAANYIGICGQSLQCFALKIVKYGLLGAHSLKIIKEMSLLKTQYGHDIIWSMLLAFLDCMGLKSEVFFSTTSPPSLIIKEAYRYESIYWYPMPQSINKTVLKKKLPKRKNRKRHTNEKILTWLLEYIGCSSLQLEYCVKACSIMNSELLPNLQKSLSKKYSTTCMEIYIAKLKLRIWSLDSCGSLQPMFKFYEILSAQARNIYVDYTSNQNFLILVKHLSLCQSLKELTIFYKAQDFQVVKELLESLPNIELLSIHCQILLNSIIPILENCKYLTKLYLYGRMRQTDRFIDQFFFNVLPNLKDLGLSCETISQSTVENFVDYPDLKSLHLTGNFQYNSRICNLLRHTPFLQHLNIHVDELNWDLANTIRHCEYIKSITLNIQRTLGEFFDTLFRDPTLVYLKKLKVYSSSEYGFAYETVLQTDDEYLAVKKAKREGVKIRIYS
ncbi:hypothetical protein NECID01_1164 [Nematocida sp. AWRm77]|nr:hypothetical protein NECID01_1164 [Nematocida sp. AWRm77]